MRIKSRAISKDKVNRSPLKTFGGRSRRRAYRDVFTACLKRASINLNNREHYFYQKGFTLIELVVFIVIIGITVVAIGSVFQHSAIRIQDPIIHSQLLSMAQSQLDEIMSRKYDENTPTGGIPVCGDTGVCAGIGLDTGELLTDNSTLDDVDDFNHYQDIPQTGYSRTVSVTYAGSDFGVTNSHAKRVTVSVTAPGGQQMQLSVYRFNF